MSVKDQELAQIASEHNVAQFISFGPGLNPGLRYSALTAGAQVPSGESVAGAVQALLQRSGAGSVNVRSFRLDQPSGNPFHYGLTNTAAAANLVARLAAEGYYTIVNETIDVNDGGVSGVYEGGVIEFAPGATPRVVESSDHAALPFDLAIKLLQRVYGFEIGLGVTAGRRVEFSIHPLRVGTAAEHVVLWERSVAPPMDLTSHISWPNNFSSYIGDKVYGLLVAELMGASVPLTRVFNRSVPPFVFGRESGTGETWLRTAPRTRTPGEFTTRRGWADPFELMSLEDPRADRIASVLAQDGIDAAFSGAAVPQGTDGNPLIEGVRGYGDDFMLGNRPPEDLPGFVVADIAEAWAKLSKQIGPVSIEWAHDGQEAWILQLHCMSYAAGELGVIVLGEPNHGWLKFTAGDNLDRLKDLVREAGTAGMGIQIDGRVGLTSHVGDILRQAGVPARQMVSSDSAV
jgi:hypothetical protein